MMMYDSTAPPEMGKASPIGGMINMMKASTKTTCVPLSTSMEYGNPGFAVDTALWSFPFKCVSGSQHSCVKDYGNHSNASLTFVHGVEWTEINEVVGFTDGLQKVKNYEIKTETVDQNGNVDESLSIYTTHNMPAAMTYPRLGTMLKLAGVSLEDHTPTGLSVAPNGVMPSLRVTGMMFAIELELFNLDVPAGAYHGKLMDWWSSLWATDTSVYNWKIKRSYQANTGSWGIRKKPTMWSADGKSGTDNAATGVNIYVAVTGNVYTFSFPKLVQVLVSSVVLLGVAQTITDLLLPHIAPNFESHKYLEVEHDEEGNLRLIESGPPVGHAKKLKDARGEADGELRSPRGHRRRRPSSREQRGQPSSQDRGPGSPRSRQRERSSSRIRRDATNADEAMEDGVFDAPDKPESPRGGRRQSSRAGRDTRVDVMHV